MKNIKYNDYDVVIIGSGFAGSITAQKFAQLNKKVLLLEKRNHIGGNMYDEFDKNGVLVQKYGPHILRSRDYAMYEYLKQFSDFFPYRHIVKAQINENLCIPLPFNLNSLKLAFPKEYNEYKDILISKFGFEKQVSKAQLIECGLEKLADFIYKNVFENYTNKQWKMYSDKIDLDAVLKRVPMLNLSNRDGYFNQEFQYMPTNGFTKMFENMLKSDNIDLVLNFDAMDIISFNEKDILLNNEIYNGELIFTGPVDELFNYEYGMLPYLSVNFEYFTKDQMIYQECGTINYPNTHDYTRESEFKYLSNQELDPKLKQTITMRETSCDFVLGKNERFYPIPGQDYVKDYEKYANKSKKYKNLHLLGRLAEYKYYDMDVIIFKTLNYFEDNFKNR